MRHAERVLDAVIFDFDGLMIDTETALYEAWTATFAKYGVEPIERSVWARSIGRSTNDPDLVDPLRHLAERIGPDVDLAEAEVFRRDIRNQKVATAGLQPGLTPLLDELSEAGIPLAVASSSGRDWVEGLLGAFRLRHRFQILACAGESIAGKPDPATYLLACEGLEVPPARAVAIEDSTNGVIAATDAGLPTVAVPAGMTADADVSRADLVVGSLGDLSLDTLRSLQSG